MAARPDEPAPAPGSHAPDQHVVVICQAGYASSLAAASLRQLGLTNATDLIGGFEAWAQAGLPIAGRVYIGGSSPGTEDGAMRTRAPNPTISSASGTSIAALAGRSF